MGSQEGQSEGEKLNVNIKRAPPSPGTRDPDLPQEVQEFKWNLDCLLRNGFPNGLPLDQLEEQYHNFTGKNIQLSLLSPGPANNDSWSTVLSSQRFRREFRVQRFFRQFFVTSKFTLLTSEDLTSIVKMINFERYKSLNKSNGLGSEFVQSVQNPPEIENPASDAFANSNSTTPLLESNQVPEPLIGETPMECSQSRTDVNWDKEADMALITKARELGRMYTKEVLFLAATQSEKVQSSRFGIGVSPLLSDPSSSVNASVLEVCTQNPNSELVEQDSLPCVASNVRDNTIQSNTTWEEIEIDLEAGVFETEKTLSQVISDASLDLDAEDIDVDFLEKIPSASTVAAAVVALTTKDDSDLDDCVLVSRSKIEKESDAPTRTGKNMRRLQDNCLLASCSKIKKVPDPDAPGGSGKNMPVLLASRREPGQEVKENNVDINKRKSQKTDIDVKPLLHRKRRCQRFRHACTIIGCMKTFFSDQAWWNHVKRHGEVKLYKV